MAILLRFGLVLMCIATSLNAQQTINGQIITPGIAIIDAPQPNTPLGGDYLQIALDVTSNGQLQLPPYSTNSASAIHNITIFLSSYSTGKNLTISNGTATANNASLGAIMAQEPSSTVKHINWVWPACFVGDGTTINSDRGAYNISIRQNFKLNGTERYTIFDLPIQISNSIAPSANRSSCASLNNPLLDQATLIASADNFTRIAGTAIQGSNSGSSSSSGIGGTEMLDWRTSVHVTWVVALIIMFVL